ncbi:MAG: nitroreductase family protein [Theionarchaea archaeon]|nr:nitroreductase family protein [Theionarchaea archaeon]MBU7001813.1 nitroreductase family protein [Theionarchaea archaeon]MBU7020458.1 nitroreductase family protein [Theionarchaea archaeon]MBU7034762.1 nitroreductase family protein [Theionarchaea archaeon]MBU7041079.1 nitroreductase family protein [Theionarchaea archaeon]
MNDISLIEGLKTRRSIRSYLDKPVPDSLIEELLDVVRWAPSSSNNQPWRFVVVRDQQKKENLRGGLRDAVIPFSKHIVEAPVVFVAWYTPSIILKKWQISDVSNAVTYLLLAAHARGLGTCWIGWFSEERVKKTLNLPRNAVVVAVVTAGYTSENPEPRRRKPISDITYRETFDTSW